MGGYVAFEILRRALERVERLALIDTQATPDSPESIARRRGLIEQTQHRPLPWRAALAAAAASSIARHLDNPAITQPILDMAREIGAEGFVREQQAIMARPDSRPLLVDIEVPDRGDRRPPGPGRRRLPRAEEMAADISTSRLVVLEECGHMSPLERPDEVTAALRRWLTE